MSNPKKCKKLLKEKIIKKDEFLDYVFPTIEEALLFFVVKQKFDNDFN